MRARLGTAGYSAGTLLIKSSAISPCATPTTPGRSASTGLLDLSADGIGRNSSGRISYNALRRAHFWERKVDRHSGFHLNRRAVQQVPLVLPLPDSIES